MARSALGLIVMSSSANSEALIKQLEGLGIEFLATITCRQARQLLRADAPIDVVITDTSLPDGNWSDVLREVVDSGSQANVVVNAIAPDAVLWSEVLWRGVYDMITAPHKRHEVRQVIGSAVRTSFPRSEVAGLH